MSKQNSQKLNQLVHEIPEGLLVSAAWLEKKGYSAALRKKYVAAKWLEQPAHGVFRRPGGRLQWQEVVLSLQHIMQLPVIVGGRSALELHGFSHYVSMGPNQPIHLYGDKPLPGWVSKLDLPETFVFHNAKKLFQEEPIAYGLTNAKMNLADGSTSSRDPVHRSFNSFASQSWGSRDWPLTLSTPERAILEFLDEVPQRESFHQADVLMEGLRTLSPRRLQKLLQDCRSVKVKRLFLWFSERHHFRWLNQIDRQRIDLGKGKRMLVRGGKFNGKYQITVPENLDGGE